MSNLKSPVGSNITKIDFRSFQQAVQKQFNHLKETHLFRAKVDRDELWALYLSSFPPGTNPTFRDRSEHDCSACRSFVKNAGAIVAIIDGEVRTLWDVEVGGQYQPVADALAEFIRSKPIENIFLTSELVLGQAKNYEQIEGSVRTWEHFHVATPSAIQCSKQSTGPKLAEFRASHDVLLRSLQDITPDAIETVQDLISQNSLLRGAEKKKLVDAFAIMKKQFDNLNNAYDVDLFAWSQVMGPNGWVCKIRNDVIGTLLVDLSTGKDLEKAVESFENKVHGANYKRPTALITPKMRDAAKQALIDLGLISALERRYAKLEDINVRNVLFADRNAKTRLAGDVFDEIVTKGDDSKSFGKVEEITIEKFIRDILPTASKVEVLFENKHSGNLVSLIAPADATAKSLFKWNNPFSWSYNGDFADSIKERVKQAGGNVTGDVCCRLAWYNFDDLDFHMKEPGSYEISYLNKAYTSPNGGRLDVDMNAGGGSTRTPVENIFYSIQKTMRNGTYELFVHQFQQRERDNVGFEVEIDILGTIHSFSYPKALKTHEKVPVANLIKGPNGVEIVPILESSHAKKKVWNIDTQTFHPVTAVMLSPNFWDGEGIGNKHFFFMLNGCENDGSARGFYNEFLTSNLEGHRKAMELVGAKMRTEETEDQMSGLGFSSTQRNTLVVRVHGSFQRTLKIAF